MKQKTFDLRVCLIVGTAVFLGSIWATSAFAKEKRLPPTHYRVEIDPKTPERSLLPIPPKAAAKDPLLVDDLARVPEVQLHEPFRLPKAGADEEKLLFGRAERSMIYNARLAAHINFVNKKKTDRFMELLVENRPDLAGLPLVMGDACRMKPVERKQFKSAVQSMQALSFVDPMKDTRWENYDNLRRKDASYENRFFTAACMQMTALESTDFRLGLVKRLAEFDKSYLDKLAATEALTKLAVFAQDEEVRLAAIAALLKRELSVDTAMLLHGLRYPWPSIAVKSAETIADLKRNDLAPELVKVLDEPDPRAPATRIQEGKKVLFVREVVKINHHRNCLLCHPPGNTPDVLTFESSDEPKQHRAVEKGVTAMFVNIKTQADDVLTGSMPTVGEELSSGFDGYRSFASPDILVRADITYLRQDFSLAQSVADAKPWPEKQRFDYLVRTRVVTEKEADTVRSGLAKGSEASAYREAALAALRRLTGQDAGATAQAWRAALRIK